MSIRAIIFGSTGMIGQGVLKECLESHAVEAVLIINRRASGLKHPKLKEAIFKDFLDMSSQIPLFSDYDTCFYCLGVTSLGLSEEEYSKVTYGLTISIASSLLKANPQFTFCYISGMGSDSTA